MDLVGSLAHVMAWWRLQASQASMAMRVAPDGSSEMVGQAAIVVTLDTIIGDLNKALSEAGVVISEGEIIRIISEKTGMSLAAATMIARHREDDDENPSDPLRERDAHPPV